VQFLAGVEGAYIADGAVPVRSDAEYAGWVEMERSLHSRSYKHPVDNMFYPASVSTGDGDRQLSPSPVLVENAGD
jgi:hypothetical protein